MVRVRQDEWEARWLAWVAGLNGAKEEEGEATKGKQKARDVELEIEKEDGKPGFESARQESGRDID